MIKHYLAPDLRVDSHSQADGSVRAPVQIEHILSAGDAAVMFLDVIWRQRLELAALRYAAAKRAVISAASEAKCTPSSDGSCSIQQTIAAENEALREYTRVLGIFTRIVLDGKPDEWSSNPDWQLPGINVPDRAETHR